MALYTQGIANDGAVLLKDGAPMTPEEIVEELNKFNNVIDEVHGWAVCSAIATPDDMYQNFPRIVEITTPSQD